MDVRRHGLWAGLLVAVALGVLGYATKSAHALLAAHLPSVALAAAAYSAGFIVFSAVWGSFLRKALEAGGAPPRAPFRFGLSMLASLAALAGLLTPMNLGTDVLRSVLGKRYLGAEVGPTAAASVATRECKLHVALALALAVAASAPAAAFGGRMLPVLSGLAALSAFLFCLRSRFAERLARPLGLNRLVEEVRNLSSRTPWRRRMLFYAAFIAGFALECVSVGLCLRAVGLAAGFGTTFIGYGVLYFLSRVPGVPLGIGLVEAGGFGFFRLMGFPPGQAGALMVLWGFQRIAVPYAIAAAASICLLRRARAAGSPPVV